MIRIYKTGLGKLLSSFLAVLCGLLPSLQVLAEIPVHQEAFVQKLLTEESLPEVDLKFESNDPLLDQDPYFLRSQAWIDSKGEISEPQNLEIAVGITEGSVRIGLSDGLKYSASWQLNQNLGSPILTNEFILLFAKDSSLFEGKSKLTNGSAQGAFAISKQELVFASLTKTRVPVYFMPLPNGEWTGEVERLPFGPSTVTGILNSKDEPLPIFESDLLALASIQRFFIALSMIQNLETHGLPRPVPSFEKIQHASGDLSQLTNFISEVGALSILPPRGCTAGFGLFYTGMDLDHPEVNFTQGAQLKRGFLEKLGNFFIPSAFAQGAELSPEEQAVLDSNNAKLKSRLIRVGVILGVAFAASVVLRYTYFRKVFEARRQKAIDESKEDRIQETVTIDSSSGVVINREFKEIEPKKPGIAQNAKEILDVYSHSLLFMMQAAPVLFPNMLEYSLDRWAPRMTAHQNSWIRKFLDKTIFFTRNQNSQIPVNWNTWVRGSLVLGGIDVFFVGVQLYQTNGYIAQKMPGMVPADGLLDQTFPGLRHWLESRVDEAFGGQNAITDNLNRNELIRNLAAYLTSGAVSYSQDIRSQFDQIFTRKVEEEMQREGLDMTKPSSQSILRDRVDHEVSKTMRKLGLPGKEDFLFDFITINNWAYDKMGFHVASELRGTKEQPLVFTGEKRTGLVLSSLKLAIAEAKRRRSENPAAKKAYELLQDSWQRAVSDADILKDPLALMVPDAQEAKDNREKIARAIEARREITALTYEGEAELNEKNIPASYTASGNPDAARLAAMIYRRSFLSLVEGDRKILSGPDLQEEFLMRTEAQSLALKNLKTKYPELTYSVPTAYAIPDNRRSEFQVLYETALLQIQKEANHDSKKAESPQDPWFIRAQKLKASMRADASFRTQFGRDFDPAGPSTKDFLRWAQIFSRESMGVVGLYPDYEANPALKKIVTKTTQEVAFRRWKDSKYQESLQSLSPREKAIAVGGMIAEIEMSEYLNQTVNGDKISPLSPAQPGLLQKLRQSAALRADTTAAKFGTRILRGIESFWPGTEYKFGLMSKLYRVIPFPFPFSYDTNTTIVRSFQRLPYMLTLGYLWNRFAWGADVSWTNWLLFGLFTFTISAPAQWLSRFFMNQKWQPMNNMKMTILNAVIYSWATFWGTIPMYLVVGDFNEWFGKIFAPALGALLAWKLIPETARSKIKSKLFGWMIPKRKSDKDREVQLQEVEAWNKRVAGDFSEAPAPEEKVELNPEQAKVVYLSERREKFDKACREALKGPALKKAANQ